MDFPAEEKYIEMVSITLNSRSNVRMEVSFRKAAREANSLAFPTQEKLGIGYILGVWKEHKENDTGEALSLVERFDDLIQRRLQTYVKAKRQRSPEKQPAEPTNMVAKQGS